jgi:hypothetical protein
MGMNIPFILLANNYLKKYIYIYSMTKQKGFVIILFLKKFHHYLLQYKAKIVTNHKALTYLVNKSNPNG